MDQNLAVIVVWILARHMGQRPPAAMMSLAQPWQVHCRCYNLSEAAVASNLISL